MPQELTADQQAIIQERRALIYDWARTHILSPTYLYLQATGAMRMDYVEPWIRMHVFPAIKGKGELLLNESAWPRIEKALLIDPLQFRIKVDIESWRYSKTMMASRLYGTDITGNTWTAIDFDPAVPAHSGVTEGSFHHYVLGA